MSHHQSYTNRENVMDGAIEALRIVLTEGFVTIEQAGRIIQRRAWRWRAGARMTRHRGARRCAQVRKLGCPLGVHDNTLVQT